MVLLRTVILLLVLHSSHNVIVSDSIEEAHALLKWKASFDNQTQSLLSSSWTLSCNTTNCNRSISACSWYGISCNSAGSIIRINLTNSGLIGTLFEFAFSSFPNLAHVELSMNKIFGTIPPEIGQLPELTYLDLSHNQLSGSIPNEISQLGSLNELALNTNNFDGSIPASFGNLSNLVYLYLHDNKLSGFLPPEIGNLSNLVEVHIGANRLTGPIPSTFGNLKNLTVLYMFDNLLSGPIPSELGNLKSLTNLSLQMNYFSGSIPASLGNLEKLTFFHLNSNNLSSSIADEIGKLKSLVDIQFNDNQLSGSIPAAIGNLSNLQTLYLQDNQFVGNISEFICISPSMRMLNLGNNKFYGELPSNWGTCRQLASFQVAGNNIHGSIPPEIGNSTQLQVLDLSSSNLVGEIPKEFGKLTSLFKLILRNNQFSGGIPQEFGSLTNLEYLDLSMNKLNQSIPESFGDFLKLHYMNLSYNQFRQEIPARLALLVQLNELDLSHNLLAGEIPSILGDMESLETLNLSHNGLSGVIPADFGGMSGLLYVDISYNKLHGPVPDNKAFRHTSIGTLKVNNGLCGNNSGLQPCEVHQPHKNVRGKGPMVLFRIILPVTAALFLSCALLVLFCRIRGWKRDSRKQMSIENNARLERIENNIGQESIENNVRLEWILNNIGESDVESASIESSENLLPINLIGNITNREIIQATNNFDAMYCIGAGGSGRVYKAMLHPNNIVAVKKFYPLHNGMTDHQKAFFSEIRALTEIRHRNIVKLFGFCRDEHHLFLVTKYVERGSLAKILSNDETAKELDWVKRINIIKDVANALSYIHHDQRPPIVHKDISSNNILVNEEFTAQVSDFGAAKLLMLGEQHSGIAEPNWTSPVGSLGYDAPELAHTGEVTVKCDVYSFGLIVLEVIKGKHPANFLSTLSFPCTDMEIKLGDVLDERLSIPTPEVEDKLVSMMEMAFLCLDKNPHLRPTMRFVSRQLYK